MSKITSIEELDRISEECKKSIEGKLSGADHKRHIVLCGGTGCLSSNSKEIAAKFVELLAKKGMNEKATVNLAGCFGFCSQGPFVKIYPEDTLYRMVTLADVEEIIDSDIGHGQVVERLLYVDPVSGEKVSKQDDINFYKKQRRIALHGCGVINPEDLNEAIGFGAFQG
ncbi:MAG: (2Fe-2S) ferredoxin domain-containing protein, partial [Lachnospiraceae bacterium]|nr:(2Fe-2S) ferredoxin domain-containing protein [Lachnospiraceae bacterium]